MNGGARGALSAASTLKKARSRQRTNRSDARVLARPLLPNAFLDLIGADNMICAVRRAAPPGRLDLHQVSLVGWLISETPHGPQGMSSTSDILTHFRLYPTFALQNRDDTARNLESVGNSRGRNRVGWRNDCTEDKAGSGRQAHEIVREPGNCHGGEQHVPMAGSAMGRRFIRKSRHEVKSAAGNGNGGRTKKIRSGSSRTFGSR